MATVEASESGKYVKLAAERTTAMVELTITELGHEEPTLLLTNQLDRPAARAIGRYAQRMVIESSIEDGVDFFHMDALSSAVALKVNCDLELTLLVAAGFDNTNVAVPWLGGKRLRLFFG